MIIVRQKVFSNPEKDNSLRNAGIVAGIGGSMTGLAIEKTKNDIKTKANKKLSDYKKRANDFLSNKMGEVDRKVEVSIENARKETKAKLNEGRQNYKKSLRETRSGIKRAKQELAESSRRAGEEILFGKNTAEYGVNMKLPSGNKFSYHAKEGYDPNMTKADRESIHKMYKNSQVTNNLVNNHTKHELADLRFNHSQSQKGIVESGKAAERLIQQEANKEKEVLRKITDIAIKNRDKSISNAANKLIRKRGGKIVSGGLAATGLAAGGTYAYTKHKNKNK